MSAGAADGRITIDTALNNKGLIKGIGSIKNDVGGLTSVVKKLGAVIASVFAVRSLVSFGKECVELGSDIAEVQNVVDVAFGDMAYKIEAFADTSIQQFGMSRLAAKKTASTYMAMAKGMGMADEAASDMAISLTGLSGDVASFFNISQELADIKLKSVFTGETETLKDLGVVMTQTNLKAFALEQGIKKDITAMTQAELVSLRYNFVLKQLALANGDFAHTSDSWANQTRILSMQWQEFMSIIGQSLITVLTPLVKNLNTVVSSLISTANTINSVVSSLFGGANTQIQQTQANAVAVSGAIEGSVENQDALTEATEETAKAQQKALAGFDEVNKLSEETASSAAGGSVGIAASAPTVSQEVITEAGNSRILAFFESLRAALQPVTDALGRLWDALKLVGSFAGDALKDFYETFLKPVGAWVMGEGLPRFVDAITNGLAAVNWQRINDALHTLWEALAPFATKVGEGLLWLWENVLVPFGAWSMNEIVPLFIEGIAAALDLFNAVWEIAQPGLEWLWSNFLLPVAEWTGGLIVDALGLIVDALRVLGNWISENQELVQGMAITAGVFCAAWEVGALAEFMVTAASLPNVLKLVTDAIKAGTVVKAKDKIAAIQLCAEWVRLKIMAGVDMVKALGASAIAWAAETAAKVKDKIATVAATVAQAAHTAAVTAGTIATTAFGVAMSVLTSPITLVVAAIAGLIAGIVLLVKNWDTVKSTAANVWNSIKSIWGAAAAWIDSTVIEPITSGFKGFFNGLIGMVENFVNFFIRGVNGIIKGLNKIQANVPDGVPFIGGTKFGINIPTVSELKLPRLATGAVIPPNREFMAVLGDQKSGNNIEAPEDLIRKIVREESGDGESIELLQAILDAIKSGHIIMVDSTVLGRTAIKSINDANIRAGKQLLLI